jgi:uncharacterized protein YjbI with pentapeptide repeats
VDDSETVWVEREYVGHGFRDDDLSRLRTERVVFDECDFRGVNLTESEHAGSAFRNCTFDRAILHHSTFRQRSLFGSVYAQPLQGARSGAIRAISAVTCSDPPIVKGCEHFHLMQLGAVNW